MAAQAVKTAGAMGLPEGSPYVKSHDDEAGRIVPTRAEERRAELCIWGWFGEGEHLDADDLRQAMYAYWRDLKPGKRAAMHEAKAAYREALAEGVVYA